MKFVAAKLRVLNRGSPSDAFLTELVEWGRDAPDDIFEKRPPPLAPLPDKDIFARIVVELGPFDTLQKRRAALLEVMRVLAMFESSGDFSEGIDTSRLGKTTPVNAEAGAWQVSYGSRRLAPELAALLIKHGVTDGISFQRAMKGNHSLAMEYIARLIRNTTEENGPLYKGDERLVIRKSLRGAENTIYPWLSRASAEEIRNFLEVT